LVILDAVLSAAKDLFREWKRSDGKRTSSVAAAAVTGAASTAAASAASARGAGAMPASRVPPVDSEVYETRPPKKHRRNKKPSPHDKKKYGRKV
jgi:hypothetical protein